MTWRASPHAGQGVGTGSGSPSCHRETIHGGSPRHSGQTLVPRSSSSRRNRDARAIGSSLIQVDVEHLSPAATRAMIRPTPIGLVASKTDHVFAWRRWRTANRARRWMPGPVSFQALDSHHDAPHQRHLDLVSDFCAVACSSASTREARSSSSIPSRLNFSVALQAETRALCGAVASDMILASVFAASGT